MKKWIFFGCICAIVAACNNSATPLVDEQKQRDSLDAAQRIKDSMDVEAKMMADMAGDTSETKPEVEVPSNGK